MEVVDVCDGEKTNELGCRGVLMDGEDLARELCRSMKQRKVPVFA